MNTIPETSTAVPTRRIQASSIYKELAQQDGKTLPFLLERYLLLENWRREKWWDSEQDSLFHLSFEAKDEISYLHLLLAEAASYMLVQEERLRALEAKALLEQRLSALKSP